MNILEELKSAGTYPSGPCSAWPQERNKRLLKILSNKSQPQEVKVTYSDMAKSALKTLGQAVNHGKVSSKIRKERYEICKACPAFIEDSKRCSECGCFMEAKTWVGGDPNTLCPLRKWER